MSEIFLRTDKVEYESGHTIYGVVYLKVDTPTGGQGIECGILGQEQYNYHNIKGCQCGQPPREIVLRRERKHIDNHHILYQTTGPLALGEYVIPFKMMLPDSAPGTICWCSREGPKWDAAISYRVWARVIGAEEMKVSQGVVISPRGSDHFHNSSTPPVHTVQVVSISKFLKVVKMNFTIGGSLDKSVYRIGDTVRLSLQTKSLSSNRITRIVMELLRHIKLMLASQDGAAASADTESALEPEDGPVVEWSASIQNTKDIQLNIVRLMRRHNPGLPTVHGLSVTVRSTGINPELLTQTGRYTRRLHPLGHSRCDEDDSHQVTFASLGPQ